MEIIRTTTNEKKDIVRATNAVTGAQDMVNEQIKLLDVIIYDKADEDGEIKRVTALKVMSENGTEEFITSISPTVESSVDTILSLYSDEEIKAGLMVAVRTKQSKAGRNFYYIDLV